MNERETTPSTGASPPDDTGPDHPDELSRLRCENAALRDSEEFLRLSQRIASVGSWRWDFASNRVQWSEEMFRIFGVDREAFDGTPEGAALLFHPEDRERVEAAIRQGLEEGLPNSDEYRILRRDGSERFVLGHGDIIRGDDGSAVGMIGTILDITERKRLEAELLESKKLESIGRLAGGVAHDFNNFLTVIFGALHVARNASREGSELDDSLQTIQSASDHASRLTRQLLAFARMQFVELTVVDVKELIEELEPLLRRMLREDIELEAELAPELWKVRADSSQLSQVLMNLATNARDAMPNGGLLSIRATNLVVEADDPRIDPDERPGYYVRLTVRDTGCGMDERTLQRAFEPFFTTREAGEGLGLASCYGIVKQIGGHIGVTSEPGAGATFTVDLPRTTDRAPASLAETETALPQASETVLVVEDDAAVRGVLVNALQSQGHRVLEAADGKSALATAARHPTRIDVLVTDTVMPRMTGTELIREIRKVRPETRVLLISGYAGDEARADDIDEFEFLQKPFTPSALARKVRALLDR